MQSYWSQLADEIQRKQRARQTIGKEAKQTKKAAHSKSIEQVWTMMK